jgi:hypothetical protein
MKKITLLAIAAVAISFASCKKDRVCECTTSGSTTTTKFTLTKISKGHAKDACSNSAYTNSGNSNGGSTTTCTLK